MFKNQDKLFDAVPLRNALQTIKDLIRESIEDEDIPTLLSKIEYLCDKALAVPAKEDLRFFGGELTTNEKLLNSFEFNNTVISGGSG